MIITLLSIVVHKAIILKNDTSFQHHSFFFFLPPVLYLGLPKQKLANTKSQSTLRLPGKSTYRQEGKDAQDGRQRGSSLAVVAVGVLSSGIRLPFAQKEKAKCKGRCKLETRGWAFVTVDRAQSSWKLRLKRIRSLFGRGVTIQILGKILEYGYGSLGEHHVKWYANFLKHKPNCMFVCKDSDNNYLCMVRLISLRKRE